MRATAIAPAPNGERTVGHVLQACPEHVEDVVVVDTGSEDETCRAAASRRVRVVPLKRRGKGLAVHYAAATDDADILVFIDVEGCQESAGS